MKKIGRKLKKEVAEKRKREKEANARRMGAPRIEKKCRSKKDFKVGDHESSITTDKDGRNQLDVRPGDVLIVQRKRSDGTGKNDFNECTVMNVHDGGQMIMLYDEVRQQWYPLGLKGKEVPFVLKVT